MLKTQYVFRLLFTTLCLVSALSACNDVKRAARSTNDTSCETFVTFNTLDRLKTPPTADKFEEIRKAAEGNQADAQYDLGVMYLIRSGWLKGVGQTDDAKQAVEWIQKSANQGHMAAQFLLSEIHRNGWGVPRNNTLAIAWIEKAAEQGNAEAQHLLGEHYFMGVNGPQNNRLGFAWTSKAAEQRHAPAQSRLCLIHLHGMDGVGITPNPLLAFSWCNKAASQGFPLAQEYLSEMYTLGQGVAKDDRQALIWLRKGAEQGSILAQISLSEEYIDGKRLDKDPAQAYMWLSIAKSASIKKNCNPSNVGETFLRLEAQMTPEQIQRGKSLVNGWKPKTEGKRYLEFNELRR